MYPHPTTTTKPKPPKKILPGNYISLHGQRKISFKAAFWRDMLVPRRVMQQTPASSLLLLLCLNQDLTCLWSFWGQAILGFKNPCLHWRQNLQMAHCNSARLSNTTTVLHFCNAKESMKRMDMLTLIHSYTLFKNLDSCAGKLNHRDTSQHFWNPNTRKEK